MCTDPFSLASPDMGLVNVASEFCFHTDKALGFLLIDTHKHLKMALSCLNMYCHYNTTTNRHPSIIYIGCFYSLCSEVVNQILLFLFIHLCKRAFTFSRHSILNTADSIHF